MLYRYLSLRLIFGLMILSLNGCSDSIEKLKRVGRAPKLANLDLPSTEKEEIDEETKLMHEQNRSHMRKTNSLWQPGSITFFRDSRTWRVGDIVQVVVSVKDSASLANSTQQQRNSSDSMGIPNLFGKEGVIAKALSSTAQPANLLNTNSKRNNSGSGNISRRENVNAVVAALVTKILPNGNLVIQGHQEIRVNHELREVKVAGIIRPKDIASDNSISSSQIAEARISYGGRGIVSDAQQPRVGSQIIDAISPF